MCSAPAPLFLVLKRERIPFLNLRPDAQGWEDLEGGGRRRGMKRRERERETEWEKERREREGAKESQRELLATLLRL